MIRYAVVFILASFASVETTNAGHFFPHRPQIVIAAPVVAYQPAYVVPVATYAVTTNVPVTSVSYATSYYAPLVPMVGVVPVAVAPVVYAPPVYVAPVYPLPVYGYGNSFHSRLNVHRNGSYNYHVHVR